MTHVLENIWHGALAASWIEQAATVLGLLGVWLATRQRLLNFPVGLVQVTLTGLVFFQQRLYADATLQGLYLFVLAYGWWCWTHPASGRRQLPVTRLSPPALAILVLAGLAATGLWGVLLHLVDDSMPFRDAFIACFGVLSQWLEARKKLEAWGGWVVVNVTGIGMYSALGLYWFVVLYVLYLALSAVGFFAWRASMRTSRAA